MRYLPDRVVAGAEAASPSTAGFAPLTTYLRVDRVAAVLLTDGMHNHDVTYTIRPLNLAPSRRLRCKHKVLTPHRAQLQWADLIIRNIARKRPAP